MKARGAKKVMVFGVFDWLHPGHLSFLKQAAQYGDELIVVVARDSSVKKLKNKIPVHNEKERLLMIKKEPLVHLAVLGDSRLGSYDVIKKYKPDLICLGYDQKYLEKDLKQRMEEKKIPLVSLIVLDSYEPDRFHTKLLT